MIRILITGGKGQLGIELNKQLNQKGTLYTVISADHHTLDITDLNQVQQFVYKQQPHIIINCAAYTQVDKCEQEKDIADKVNRIGPQYLALVSKEIGAKLVHISTDYVFSGDEYLPRKETDEVNPKTIYGITKWAGEEEVRKLCEHHFIIRTAWLYGEGNNFVRTMLKLSETNKELNVVADQFGNPTYTKDLAIAIINLMQTEDYGTYHGTCEGTCSWYDFAKKIFEVKGIDIKVNPVTSEQFPRPAKRPFYSSLDNFMLKIHGMNTFRTWEEALEDYLSNEKIGVE